jgi:general secretion pathway protein A
MYNTHYSFKRKPFGLTPDPEFIWLSQAHRAAVSGFKLAVQENEGILVLTGDVGTGKTTFTHYLLKMSENQLISVSIPFPDLDDQSFFQYLSDELGMNRDFENKGAFLFHFDNLLHEMSERHKSVMIIIDDAQNMSPQLIRQVQLLAGIKKDGKKLIRILMVAQSNNNEKFEGKIKIKIGQPISFSHHLKALTKFETQRYIGYRLEKAGAAADLIEPDSIDAIYSYSGGCPRLINTLCDRALLAGYAEGIHKIKKATILQCIRELR